MKKYVSLMLTLTMAALLATGFTGCKKLSPSYLKASYHIKKGNGFYTEEKYKKAIEEYELALQLNPEVKKLYLYLGTSYSSLYKPGKEDERNKDYGAKAVDYLKKAQENDPANENIINALGNVYDRMGNFEEAEKIYLGIKEKNSTDPKSFYILADFYTKHQKKDEAKAMYEQRIALDPKAADGYYYYASYAGNERLWDLSIDNHEKRVLAIYDSNLLMTRLEAEKLSKDIELAEGILKNRETIRTHKSLDKAERDRLLGEADEKLKAFKPVDQMKAELETKRTLANSIANLDENKLKALPEAEKKTISEALYTLGVVCWNKSYQTPEGMMGAEERMVVINKGMKALDDALKINSEDYQAWAYVGLLWRQKITAEPLKEKEFLVKWEEALNKSKDIREKMVRAEKIKAQFEKMSEE